MRVRELKLKNYRNIEDALLTPAEGINLIWGENAQGKTNLLEAVWLFTSCKSFRGAKDRELVRFDEAEAKLTMWYDARGLTEEAALEIDSRRRAFAGGLPLPSPTKLMGEFTAVVFSPAHLSLVKNGPTERRRFLDTAICQVQPAYAAVLRAYTRALDQRNSLLKDIPYHSELLDTLDVWDERLSQAGEKILQTRQRYVSRLSQAAQTVYDGLSQGREQLEIRYSSACADRFAESLREARKADLSAGVSTVGPHRDDLEIAVGGVSARAFGSQGQQRSAALAIKMAEGEILKEVTGEYPVLLLDDVMSELDASRQDYILNHIENRQVFITCCDPDAIRRATVGGRFHIVNGCLRDV